MIGDFLKEIDSDLAEEVPNITLAKLGRMMNIVGGLEESPFPKNIGLMMFNEQPQKFFPVTQIDVVYFPDGPGGDVFEEKEFKGPIHRILQDALSHIERNYLKQTVIKYPDRAEADRIWNYPYPAIEEALVNAVYHRSYEIREPIEVRITPQELMILSFPGPDRSLKMEDIASAKAVSRRYRNRRIGEFLKELKLTEGRSTGIRKINRAIEKNGSPKAVFESDEDRSYFLVRFAVHPKSLQASSLLTSSIIDQDEAHEEAYDKAHDLNATEQSILKSCLNAPQSAIQLLDALGYKSRTGNFKKALKRLVDELAFLERTLPDALQSKNQKYRLTTKGQNWLKNSYL